jgi:ribonuclease R
MGRLCGAVARTRPARAARHRPPERKVLLKEDGSVDRIFVPPRLDAHRLIEEFMIQANVAAAETLEAKKSSVVYRIHDEPSWEKLEALREFLGSLDMNFPKAGNLRPSQFNRVLERVADTPNAQMVNEVVCDRRARPYTPSRTSAISALTCAATRTSPRRSVVMRTCSCIAG